VLAESLNGLGDGTWSKTGCAFVFAILNVPAGYSSYFVTISHWGSEYDWAKLQGVISLTVQS
jgi:hypothetical protein